ncbi:MAG: hypothetical protein AAF724_01600 [Pseudomonadota bacterium]
MARKMIKRQIKKVGNGATIALHKADLDDLGVRVGSTVNVTLSTDDDSYARTRASSLKMRRRYARTLKILGE